MLTSGQVSADRSSLWVRGPEWWSDVRLELIYRTMRASGLKSLLDVGAGDGSLALRLLERGIEVSCIEPSPSGAGAVARKGIDVEKASWSESGVTPESYRCVGMFDVLCTLSDPRAALRKVYTTLCTGGFFIFTEPSPRWVFSDHERLAGVAWRSSRKSLENLLTSEGFEVVEMRHLFAALLPFAYLRRLGSFRKTSLSELMAVSADNLPKALARIFARYFLLESLLRLPWGTTILGIAVKPK